ncbi:helix-turn-helix domain-containing protein [Riemerella anatipestifer]|uniref:helix-turn-helix domain-containing protein n=1 Tax=Riemerella anatipestifer TaxID=34085 RepID=UPI0030C48A9D
MISIIKQNIFEELVGNIRQVIREELEKLKGSFLQQKEEDAFYTVEQVAEMLGVTEKTVYGLNTKKQIAYSKFAGKCFYKKKDIMNAIDSGRIKPKHEIKLDAQKLISDLKK